MVSLRVILYVVLATLALVSTTAICGGWGEEEKPKSIVEKGESEPSQLYLTPRLGLVLPIADLAKFNNWGFSFGVGGDYFINPFTAVGGTIELDRFGKESMGNFYRDETGRPYGPEENRRTTILQLAGHAKYVQTLPQTNIQAFAGGGPALSIAFHHWGVAEPDWGGYFDPYGYMDGYSDTETKFKLGLNLVAGVGIPIVPDRGDMIVLQGRYHWSTHLAFFEIGVAYAMAFGGGGFGGGGGGW